MFHFGSNGGSLGLVLVARVGARLLGIEVQAAMAKSNLVLCNFTHSAVEAFYLPGLALIEYNVNDPVEMMVNKLTSAKTQLPYGYYHLAFCEPDKGAKPAVRENLGEQMQGDLIETSYKPCELLCKKTLKQEEKDRFRNMIADEYLVNRIVDNLPATKISSDRFLMTSSPMGSWWAYLKVASTFCPTM